MSTGMYEMCLASLLSGSRVWTALVVAVVETSTGRTAEAHHRLIQCVVGGSTGDD